MDKYIVQCFIGEGSFGRVFKAKHKETDAIVALKVIRKKGRSPNDLKNLRQECDIQRKLRHPNIITMIDSFDTDAELVVVTEFAEKELHSILGKEGCLNETRTQGITWDLVSALYYLHSHRILHRDLKPQNVLIDSEGHAKLCDFGLARNMTAATHVLTSIKGTPLYMAPELIDEKPYDHQADLWSLGCIVYELMAGEPPFCTTSIVKLVQMIRHKPVQWPTFISSDAFSFLQGLLHKDPKNRLSWPDILKHAFVAGHILILPEDEKLDSPFTKPLSHSQMEAKQLQTEKLNHIQKLSVQAVKNIKLQEHRIQKEDIPMSDDDSLRATSAFSVRDSLKTDDEDPSLLSPGHAKLLAHEYKAMNYSNLVVCNLENNLAQFRDKPHKDMDKIERIQEVEEDSNPPKISTKKTATKSKSENKKNKDSSNDMASHSMENPKNSTKSDSDVSSGLSKSVPPSYKQKFLQFSRDKLGFSSGGNKLTRSLKRSFTFNRSWDKVKNEITRRTSEPIVDIQMESESGLPKEAKDEDIEKIEVIDESSSDSDVPNNDDIRSIATEEEDVPSAIEQEEWHAFLKSSLVEVMEGDVESLTQLNMVNMVVKMSCGGARVCSAVGSLLALPGVSSSVPRHTLLQIQDVYLEAKVIHHFIKAIKRLTKETKNNKDETLEERLSGASSMLEVCSWLCVKSCRAVQQMAVAIHTLSATRTFTNLFTFFKKSPRLVTNTVGILITILQDLPEHSELVERILFEHDPSALPTLISIPNDQLRIRICILISLVCTFCSRRFSDTMTDVWTRKHTDCIDDLQTHCNATLNRSAKLAMKELSNMPFFVV